MPAAIIIIDKKFNIIFSNLNAKELLNISINKNEINNLKKTIFPGSSLFDLILRSKNRNSSIFEECLQISGPFFSDIIVSVNVSFLENHNNHKQIIMLIKKEFSSNDMLKNSASLSNKSVSGFASMLAHEIKNPLSGIRGAAQLLSSELDNTGKELADLIITETDRISKLFQRVDNIFCNQLNDINIINIHEIILYCIKIANSGFANKMTFSNIFDPSLPDINGDKNMLIQTIINLIKNSTEACNGEGILKITTFYNLWEPKFNYLGEEKRVTPINIDFSDDGIGVPDYLIDTLFNPFVSSKINGSGLGLSQVAGSMQAHGGKVEIIRSEENTTFRLSFPVASNK